MKIKIKLDISDKLDKKIQDALEEKVNFTLENAVEKAVEDLKIVTPKDTGYAASRWKSYQRNSFKFSFSLKNKYLLNLTESVHYIENDADYISYLNAGWSKQAPSYFIEQTLISNGFEPTLV